MMGKIVCFLLLSSCIQFIVIDAISFEEDTALTAKEADVLRKFREQVSSKLPHKYMEESIFLVKWLRARNFDVNAAEKMLLKHIQWRADNQIDNIDNEDWQDFEVEYPLNLEGVDKEGRPLVQIILKDWDIRKAMISGQGKRLLRWISKYFEDANKLVRKFQAEGKSVTQFSHVIDTEGFNIVTHGCPSCLSVYINIVNAFEEQYPLSMDKGHITNTPQYFRIIIQLLQPLMSKATRNALQIYGTDRAVWKKTLSETIDDDQLLPEFGGTLKAE